MVKRYCCLIALLATCVACHKGTLTVPREIEEEIDSAIAKLGNLDVLRPWHGFDEKIRAISNRTVRVACYQMRSDKLESIMRVEMEEFLGRPLRTIDQWRAMRNVDSDEIKAVKRKEIGPACFARESDPPVLEAVPPELTK